MGGILLRLAILTAGFAVMEIGLTGIVTTGSVGDWLVVLAVGLPLIVSGTYGFLTPMLSGSLDERTRR